MIHSRNITSTKKVFGLHYDKLSEWIWKYYSFALESISCNQLLGKNGSWLVQSLQNLQVLRKTCILHHAQMRNYYNMIRASNFFVGRSRWWSANKLMSDTKHFDVIRLACVEGWAFYFGNRKLDNEYSSKLNVILAKPYWKIDTSISC